MAALDRAEKGLTPVNPKTFKLLNAASKAMYKVVQALKDDGAKPDQVQSVLVEGLINIVEEVYSNASSDNGAVAVS